MSRTPEQVALEAIRRSYGDLGWGAEGDLEDGLVALLADLIRREREKAEALAEALRDLLAECVYCDGTGTLGSRWMSYKIYQAPDGSCVRCHDGLAALAAWEGRDG